MQNSIHEKILLYRVRINQDKEAFGILYDRYVGPLYRFIYFKLSNKEEAEDVTSDVFLKTWQHLARSGSETEINSLKHLLYSIARNAVIDVYRNRARRKEVPIEMGDTIAHPVTISDDLDKTQAVDELLQHIKKLKQEYQEVIFLRYVEDLSIHEIATVLGKGSTNVRVTLHRAIKKLKDIARPAAEKS